MAWLTRLGEDGKVIPAMAVNPGSALVTLSAWAIGATCCVNSRPMGRSWSLLVCSARVMLRCDKNRRQRVDRRS
jgi:hypothetical protein